MKLLLVILGILLLLLIPLPIKISMYYSPVDYYIKLYRITLISKKKHRNKARYNSINKKPIIKKERKFFSRFYRNIDTRSFIKILYNLNLRFKPLLRTKFSLDYSLNDAAKTAIFYGVLSQLPSIMYIIFNRYFNIKKFNMKINPVFKDNFLLKIETSSIIFLSFANIIYMTIIFLKLMNKAGR